MGHDDAPRDPSDVLYLDALVERCGHFTTDAPGGYGCRHPEDEGRRCFAWSCPVACQLLPSYEPLDVEELAVRGWSQGAIDDVTEESLLMLVHEEALLRVLRQRNG